VIHVAGEIVLDERRSAERLSGFVAASVDAAHATEVPFHHLVLGPVFPRDVYDAMRLGMPAASGYRPMSGRSRSNRAPDGTPTRIKIDLFPEYIRHLPLEKHAIWDLVGRALCAPAVKQALVRRLAPSLRRRFGAGFTRVGMYPIPILTRDFSGYRITPHTDTQWKAITVQIYLPPDDGHSHIGTIFHERRTDGSLARKKQMRFSPNSGYAFAVGDDTWHSVDPVGPEVNARDSILLTYFVDSGVLRILRNRLKRAGNFIGNELRYRLKR
jgi:hypothetical protein